MAKKINIGSEFVLIQQALSLMFLVMWVMMNGIFIYFNSYFNSLVVASIGLMLLIGLNFYLLRAYAISIEEGHLTMRNIFRKKIVALNDFVGVEEAFLSPWFFYIKIKDSNGAYFLADIKTILLSFVKTNVKSASDWEELIRSNCLDRK